MKPKVFRRINKALVIEDIQGKELSFVETA
jgi:hypothetical protein